MQQQQQQPKLSSTQQRVLQYIQGENAKGSFSFSAKNIAEQVGINLNLVLNSLWVLRHARLIEQQSNKLNAPKYKALV